MADKQWARCAFCKKYCVDSRRLVRGPDVAICADCVATCEAILKERDPVLGLDARDRPGGIIGIDPRRLLATELPTQPEAAAALGGLAERVRRGEGSPPFALLIGPSGTGKSLALDALADALKPLPSVSINMASAADFAGLGERIPDDQGPRVLLLDRLERVASRPSLLDELGDLLGRLHSRTSGNERCSVRAVFGAVTVEPLDEALAEPLQARVGNQSYPITADASQLLPLAASRGVPPALLAAFREFIPFRPLDGEALSLLVESRLSSLMQDQLAGGFQIQIGPEAAEMVVARALRLGGGAWGLKAVLTAMVSAVSTAEAGKGDEDLRAERVVSATPRAV